MKILHTSDWHLGHQFYKYERDDEFQYALDQIVAIVRDQQPDAFLLSGDVYDTPTPSTQAQRCFTQSLLAIHQACPTMTIVVIAGNHDGKSFLNVSRDLWSLAGVHMVGLLTPLNPTEQQLQACASDVAILQQRFDLSTQVISVPDKGFIVAVPHLYDTAYPTLSDPDAPADQRRRQYFSALMDYVDSQNPQHLPVAIMAHLAISSSDLSWHDFGAIGGLSTTDQSDFGTHYDYLALGHIHKAQSMLSQDRLARYCGSIIPISFSEESPHSVSIVNLTAGTTTLDDVVEKTIQPLYSLLTLPATPLPFDQALQSLSTLDANCKCYLRLNVTVDADHPLPPDALLQAHQMLQDKEARFCEIKVVTCKSNGSTPTKVISDPSELRGMTPLEVAQYAATEPLPQDFFSLFAEVQDRMRTNLENTSN